MTSNVRVSRWTTQEDRVLSERYLAQQSNSSPDTSPDWRQIAAALPGRSNKDCRKRWCNVLCGNLRKGAWTTEEDDLLSKAVATEGPSWIRVAKSVPGRTADQCSKRWQHCLDPSLDRSGWTDEENRTLLRAVEHIGRKWLQIRNELFPGRSPNDVKNQFTIVSRRQTQRKESFAANDGSPPKESSGRRERRSSSYSLLGLDSGFGGSDDSGPTTGSARLSVVEDFSNSMAGSLANVNSSSGSDEYATSSDGAQVPPPRLDAQGDFPMSVPNNSMEDFQPLSMDMLNEHSFPSFPVSGESVTDMMSGMDMEGGEFVPPSMTNFSMDSAQQRQPQQPPVSDMSSQATMIAPSELEHGNQTIDLANADAAEAELQAHNMNASSMDNVSMVVTVRSPSTQAMNDILHALMAHRQHVIVEFNRPGTR